MWNLYNFVKIASLLTLEALKWEYCFVTAGFTKLGSLLSGTSRHYSVLGSPHVLGHDHFGMYAISGHLQFGT